ncbi:MAG TPA: FKBP-type peptidyl-prolyl cis-trans isomerase [Cyclobacteriaceae bacterium]|jgi:FKBP-type peptidyl-prolyl cis-trans isomerase|nr:FKBP-type peptidyl-prolyl cis-trans isomerase [Cyclobacteriaceae bacterium]
MSRILIVVILCVCSLQSCITQDPISYQAQLKKDIGSLDTFVKNNNPNAIKVSTGIWYSIDDLGNGIYPSLPPPPPSSDEVTISYTIKWIEQSDSTETELKQVGYSTSTTVLLSSAISGLQQGLVFFPAGSSGKIYIPSGLAFGVTGHAKTAVDTFNVSIPANANLLYEIKLINVKGTRLASDTAAIGSYLQTNGKTTLKDSSGIRYTIDQIDTANHSNVFAHPLDSVKVTYNERVMATDSLISLVSTPTTVALADQVTCWRIMLTKKYFKEGTTFTLYSPSGYAYGSSTVSSSGSTIPANANMIYTVTLVKIIPH